jgi:hypothetical protein
MVSILKVIKASQALVAHTCDPSYLGGRDQEDQDSKPARANSLGEYLEKSQHKTGLLEWLKWYLPSTYEALSSNPGTVTKRKKKTNL